MALNHPHTNAREFLLEALSPFLIARPGIHADAEEKMSYEIVRAVAEGVSAVFFFESLPPEEW